MGAFYTNILLKGPSQEDVVKYMNEKKRKTFVSPAAGGCVVVYDEKCEEMDQQVIAALAAELSKRFACPAWAVMDHDDDVLYYFLFHNGAEVDRYDSTPGYWGEVETNEPKGGNAQKLAAVFGAAALAPALEAILRKPQSEDGFSFASERHAELIKTLGLPTLPVSLGYEYLMRGEYPADLNPETMVRTGWE